MCYFYFGVLMSTPSQEWQLRIKHTECPRVRVELTEPRERAGWSVQVSEQLNSRQRKYKKLEDMYAGTKMS